MADSVRPHDWAPRATEAEDLRMVCIESYEKEVIVIVNHKPKKEAQLCLINIQDIAEGLCNCCY